MNEEITDDDIKYFERHVKRNMGQCISIVDFCEHLLKLAKSIKWLQENVIGFKSK